jgi:pimeloyl-ACP methyl ester carboxylesterase
MPVFIITAAVIISAFIIIYIISYTLYRVAVRRDAVKTHDDFDYDVKGDIKQHIDKFREGQAWFHGQNYETVYIRSYDGLKLAGYVLPCENAVRTVICFHGYRGTGSKDFGCITRFYHENGCNLLLIDQRGHGKSEGDYICYGIKERYDCVKWAAYIHDLYGAALPVYLDGLSMGCSTVLMACGLELATNVRGVIADCGFTSPWDIFTHLIRRRYHLPVFPFLQITDHICRRRAGFGFRDVSTLDIMKQMKLPVLFVHGGNDNFVPTEMSRLNHEACVSEKYIEIIEGAGHGLSYLTATEHCQKVILDFFRKYD